MQDQTAPATNRSSTKLTVAILIVLIVILIGGWIWCWWGHRDGEESAPAPVADPGAVTAAAGPCADGAENPTPAGFTVYENAPLGYRFAYPSSWGAVNVTTTPIASETGDYVMGRFSANENVWFGGNATDYVVRGRDGIPTDLPGYLKVSGLYYTVGIWRFTDGTTTEDRHDLYPLEAPYEEMAGCNATALITHIDASEISSVGPADVARFNLQPTNHYYGVNFVLNQPTDASREDFHKLVRSFQLIP